MSKKTCCVAILLGSCFLFLYSCMNVENKKVKNVIEEWLGKELIYPSDVDFVNLDNDSLFVNEKYQYKIFVYMNSLDCLACNLKFIEWNALEKDIKAVTSLPVLFQFVFQPRRINELMLILKKESFCFPFCIDKKGTFEELNHFPKDAYFRVFLLNKDNRVLAVGNPVHNPKVKELYLKIIRGENVSQEEETPRTQTTMKVDRTEADMGRFDWREEQTAEFVLKNTGDSPLVILDTHTSCGCTQAEYDGKPVLPGDSLVLRVTYKADQPGYFRKSVLVRSNAEQELLKLMVTGEAEERK